MLLAILVAFTLPSQDTSTALLPSALPEVLAQADLAPTIEHLSVLHQERMTWNSRAGEIPALASLFDPEGDSLQQGRPRAVHYSDGYYTRLTIHKYASYLTLPLFAAQVWSGTTMWNQSEPDGFAKNVHGPLAASVAGLFAVNTVTGVWNLWEGRKDPNGRTRRVIHSLLMLTADAGFVATGASAPDDDEGEGGGHSAGAIRHRNLALGSMGVALSSYLMMLIWKD